MRSWIAAALVLAAPALAAAQTVATDPVPPPPPPPPEPAPAPEPPPPPPLTGDPLVVAGDPAVAQPVVVVEPQVVVQPEPVVVPQPDSYPLYNDHVHDPDPVPRESTLFLATATQARMSGDDGLEVFAHGAALGFGFLQRDGDFPTGGEVTAVFLRGEDAAMYGLQVRIYGSPELGRKKIVPYLAVGLAIGASRLEREADKMAGRDAAYGLSIGPTGSAGFHGFVSKKLYWRAGAGFLGTGIGAITADLGIGLVIGD